MSDNPETNQDTPKTKWVKNLSSWAGHDRNHVPGEHIELPYATAVARIGAGLASEPDSSFVPGVTPAVPPANAEVAKERIAAMAVDLATAKEEHGKLSAAHEELNGSLAKLNEELAAQVKLVSDRDEDIAKLQGELAVAINAAAEKDATIARLKEDLAKAAEKPTEGKAKQGRG